VYGQPDTLELFKYGQDVAKAIWAGVLAGLIAFAASDATKPAAQMNPVRPAAVPGLPGGSDATKRAAQMNQQTQQQTAPGPAAERTLMSIAIARGLLLWCTLINYGLLALWGVLMLLPHVWLHRLWNRWYRISLEQ